MTAGRPARVGGRLARMAGVVLLWGCADLLYDPAPDAGRPLTIRLTEVPTPARGTLLASGADAARIVVERAAETPPGELVLDTVLPLPADGETARLRLALSPSLVGASLEVRVELLAASVAVFRGSTSTTLRENGTTVVDLPVRPVVAAVRVGADPPPLASLGDVIDLVGEALFASGEVVPGVSLSWRALDAGVVEVNGAGRATAIGEGEARVEGSYEGQADTLRVAVSQVVTSLEVQPATANLRPDQRVTLTATARDANGQVVPGRTPQWSSSAASVVSVDPTTGEARGRDAGTARVTAALGELSAVATITVENPGPAVSRLSPTRATAGGTGFELSVYGSGFVAGSVIRWNGAPRETRRVAAGQLRATIPASDIATAGSVAVTVANPAPGGGVSTASEFEVTAAPRLVVEPTSLSFDMDRAGSVPTPRTIQATNAGGGSLGALRREVRYTSGSGWLRVTPASGPAPATFTAAIEAGALGAGEYAASIVIRSAQTETSVEVPVTLVVHAVTPAAPTSLTVARAGRVADLTWIDRSDDESGFRVERQVGEGEWATLGETGPGVTSYRDESLVWGGMYRYRIRAFGSGGVSQPSNEVEIVARDAPRVVTWAASDVGPGQATMSGTTNGNGVDHEVWLAWRAVGRFLHETRRLSSAPRCAPDQECTWSWTRGNLYGGQTYEFWLRAESEVGTAAGDTLRFETPPPVPSTVEAVSEHLTGSSSVRLQYRVIPGGEDFRTWLEIGRRADMQQIDVRSQEQQQTLSTRAGSTDPWSFSLQVPNLRRNTTYYWRAAARGSSGEVVYSETRRFDSQGGGGDDDDDDD